MEFLLLGPLEVRHHGVAISLGGRLRRLLAVLLLQHNRTVSNDRLIEDVWSGDPPETADNALQVHVARLRRALREHAGDGAQVEVVTQPAGYLLRVDPEALDVVRFRRLIDRARPLHDTDPEQAAELLRAALALWRGRPLGELGDEPFAQPEVARLEELRLGALEDRVEAELAGGRHHQLVAELESLVAEQPLRELLRAHLILALYRSGRQADALRVYREGRALMVEELGVEPGPQLRALEKAILVQDASLSWAAEQRQPARAVPSAPVLELERALCPVLVGRDDVMQRLQARLQSVEQQGRVVVLSGDAGAGKTRLAGELAAHAAATGMAVLSGSCSEAELSLPYLPYLEALGGALEEAHLSHLRRRLGTRCDDLAALFPQFGAATPSAHGEQARLRLFEAVVSLLAELSSEPGLLLLLDDLQWADSGTVQLTEYLVRRLRVLPVLLVLTLRSGELDRRHALLVAVERWQRSGAGELIEVTPLDGDGVRQLVQAVIGDTPHTPALAEALHARSEGNPFAVEELLKHALDQGQVLRDQSWSLAGLRLPRSVSDNILRRVDRLGAEHAEVLRSASVLGRSFDVDTLVALAGGPPDTVLAALESCVRRQLVEEDERTNAYRFRHALTRDAVYGDLLLARRQRMHGQAAAVLRDQRDADSIEIAHHLLAASHGAAAVPLLIEAAAEATRGQAHAQAVELLQRALEHAGGSDRGRVLCLLGTAAHRAGDTVAAVQHLEDGVALLEQRGAAVEAAQHRLELGRCLWERSRHAAAREQYELARRHLEPLGDTEELARADTRLAGLHSYQLEGEQAQQLAERAVAVATRCGAVQARIAAEIWRGCGLCDQALLDEGVAQLQRSRAEAESLGLRDLAAQALHYTLSVLESYGRVAQCAALLEEQQVASLDPWAQMMSAYYTVWVRFWAADLLAAAAGVERLTELAHRYGTETVLSWARGLHSVVLTELGRFDEAAALVPGFDIGLERQELVEQWWEILRLRLARGDHGGAAEVAAHVLDGAWWAAGTALPDAAVEALLAAGRHGDAKRLVVAVSGQPRSRVNTAHLERARARLALGGGDVATALPLLRTAIAQFDGGGYRLESLRTRVLLVQALGDGGQELKSLLRDAASCGAASIGAAAQLVVAGGRRSRASTRPG